MIREEDIKCGGLFKKINDELEKRANNAFRKSNLTITQANALVILNERKDSCMSIKEMEKALHVSQPTVTGIVNRLSSKGLIECFSNDSDKRVKMFRLTDKGRDFIIECEAGRNEIEKQISKDLSPTEHETLYCLLFKVMESLNGHYCD